MSSTNQHVLAQADAIAAQADQAQADYVRQFGAMTEYARRWCETVGGIPARVELTRAQTRGFHRGRPEGTLAANANSESECPPDCSCREEERAAKEEAGEV